MNYPASISLKEQRNLFFNNFPIRVISPAKINLYLNIIGKYKNGFHKIESIVNRVSIFDELLISVNRSNKINIFCNHKELENEDNLCFKAAKLIKEKFNLPFGFNIFLKKNIPLGAGLGGGSSNAAFTLKGINKLLDLRIPQRDLFKLGAILGSDVNFFLKDTSWGYMEGKGEKVTCLDLETKLKYLVVYPNIKLSTKVVYQNTKVGLTKFINRVNILIYLLRQKDLSLVEKFCFNCLEKSAFNLDSNLKSVKEFFERRGFFCMMSGSGSAFFTILNRYSKKAENTLKKEFYNKGWSIFEAQTY
ncbi:MAG: 4-(cytidine 5'-diphospho)-2-C-methyl-D-erythritol kinase [Candidatus Omnitrophica bacterium]|nr:4-(cytidine 5'-diphospho)-2-C-methyl-D-erythritol kinase [Candidatus Omnitrophota bacterium]MCM8823118.1 4-(cytidine 5'-diphospho)-2-C-methyl-D-erythritol kinase [Candidatus Omnitrophota bacterium]MCM8826197.1 4-(cytidine 5'-diphospho)-2-C-methyl-D-erythritol kinase [Candidatus Omnitrophota bacterium]